MTEADNGDKRKSLVSVSQVGWLVCERPEAKQSGCTVEAKRHQTTPPPVPMPAYCCRLVMQCDANAANSAAAELHLLLVKPTHQS